MKVILRQQIENLGGPGDVVTVKDGYAVNYLIPQQIALPHTPSNLKRIEQEKRMLAAKEARAKADAEVLAESFTGTHLHFTKKAGEEGVLYGSVTPAEIAEALERKGLIVDKRKLIIPEPIKRLGEFGIKLRPHPEVEVGIQITVLSEDGTVPAEIVSDAGEEAAEASPEADASENKPSEDAEEKPAEE